MPNIKAKDAADIYRSAQKMSNWMYNMAQQEILKDRSEDMKEMVREWDEAKKPLLPK